MEVEVKSGECFKDFLEFYGLSTAMGLRLGIFGPGSEHVTNMSILTHSVEELDEGAEEATVTIDVLVLMDAESAETPGLLDRLTEATTGAGKMWVEKHDCGSVFSPSEAVLDAHPFPRDLAEKMEGEGKAVAY
jgi:hypothetical protein